jgi:hypothetical protein
MKFKPNKIRKYRTVMVLFILMLVSVVCLPGLSARFFTSASQINQARVATFNIDFRYGTTTWTQTLQGLIRPSKTGDDNGSTLNIVNKSEVAVTYDIIIKRVTSNIEPLEIALYNSMGTLQPSEETDNSKTYSVQAAPVGQTDTYGLRLDWAEDTEGEDSNLQYMGMVDYYTITVTATQVD